MFPNDLFVIDAYKAKVLKISNDISSEIFDLEKEVGIVNPKDTTPKEENPVETITGHGKKDPFAGKPGYSSITVSQDKVSLFITNRNNGYLYHYKKNVGEGKYTLFQKVKVGKQPVACCEDPNGNIYVANYGDNTVSKVEVPSYKNTSATENEDLQDKVVKNIAVAAGPKSLVSDEEGTIWVACYLSHKIDPKTGADLGGIVNKIVNTTVVDSINVGSNPAAITCDTSNTIWVANSGSNTVSRILKSKKVVDFEVGARPVALVNDSYGNVIVANYDGNTVTIIETSSKAIKEGNNITTIPVGKGPNAIDVNMDDDVYVVCGLENTIHKISGKQVVSVVEVCDSPVAFGDFSGCANYNAQNVMAKADKGTTEEKIQTALDKAKQSEDSVKEMSARVEHALEDVKAAKQAVEAKTEQITEAVTKAGNAEQNATANAESIEAIKTGKLETTVFESYKSATAEKIDAATQKATINEENIGQLKNNKLDVTVFESYKTEADGKFATKAELAAAGTSGSGAGTGTASLTPADQAKINKIDGIETDVTSIKAVTDGLKDKTFVEDSVFTAYKSEAEGKFATKDEITTSGTGNLSVADKAKINKIDDIETAANAAKAVTDTIKDKTFVEDSAFNAYKSEVETKYATKAEITTAGTGLSSDDQAKIAKIDGIETKADDAKAVTDTLKGKTFVEESTFNTYKSDADGKFATKAEVQNIHGLSEEDQTKLAKIDGIETKADDAKAVTDTLKGKTFVEESTFNTYKSDADGKFATKAEVQNIHGLSEEDQTKLAKLDTINKEVDILNKLDALHIKILKLEPDSTGNTNTVYFEFDEVVNPISLPEDFDLNNGSILNSNDASSHPLKFVSLDGSKTETCSVGTFNDSTCFKLTYSTTTSTSFPLGDNSFVAKVILPYNPSSSTEGVNSSVFKELEVYIRTIDDNTLREKAKPDKIQMYVASGLFPVVSRTNNDGTYETYNGDYIPSSTKVNAESLLEFNDFSSSSDIGINRKIFEDATKIVDGNAAITIPLNIRETNILRGRTSHDDFNTLFFILPKELTNGAESIGVFMDYQRQIVHKYPEEKITKEAYKKYDVYYFISNTNITTGLYLNIVL